MPRISMQQAYDNRDVIAQIYKMLADVADSVAKATEAVAKALEAMETAEDAGEAAEAAQQTADGKQDALTESQLGAIEAGEEILAAIEDASAGDVLLLDENKDPSWGELELLPDATSANAGDVLTLDADKIPAWAPKNAVHSYADLGELARAIRDHPDGYFYAFTENSNFPVYCDRLIVASQSTVDVSVWIRRYPAVGYSSNGRTFVLEGSYNAKSIMFTSAATSLNDTLDRITIRGSTSDSTFEATQDTRSVSIPIGSIRGIY